MGPRLQLKKSSLDNLDAAIRKEKTELSHAGSLQHLIIIPVCVGFSPSYDESLAGYLPAVLHGLIEKKYTCQVLLYENADDLEAVKRWHTFNDLSAFKKQGVIEISCEEWRRDSKVVEYRAQAQALFNKFFEDQARLATLNGFLKQDAEKFLRRKFPKQIPISELQLNSSISYLKEEIIDALSLLTPIANTINNDLGINVWFPLGSLNQSMHYVLNTVSKLIGYRPMVKAKCVVEPFNAANDSENAVRSIPAMSSPVRIPQENRRMYQGNGPGEAAAVNDVAERTRGAVKGIMEAFHSFGADQEQLMQTAKELFQMAATMPAAVNTSYHSSPSSSPESDDSISSGQSIPPCSTASNSTTRSRSGSASPTNQLSDNEVYFFGDDSLGSSPRRSPELPSTSGGVAMAGMFAVVPLIKVEKAAESTVPSTLTIPAQQRGFHR